MVHVHLANVGMEWKSPLGEIHSVSCKMYQICISSLCIMLNELGIIVF